jgi:hypothetical protein
MKQLHMNPLTYDVLSGWGFTIAFLFGSGIIIDLMLIVEDVSDVDRIIVLLAFIAVFMAVFSIVAQEGESMQLKCISKER